MTNRFVVGFDGSGPSTRALDFAVERAQAQGASLIVAHVLEWSPYSFLTPNEIEERHVRRKQELARAETAILTPAVTALQARGIEVETILRYGHIAETLCSIATEMSAHQIFIGREGSGSFASRFFGSVAASLAQASPVPVTIVP